MYIQLLLSHHIILFLPFCMLPIQSARQEALIFKDFLANQKTSMHTSFACVQLPRSPIRQNIPTYSNDLKLASLGLAKDKFLHRWAVDQRVGVHTQGRCVFSPCICTGKLARKIQKSQLGLRSFFVAKVANFAIILCNTRVMIMITFW